jgi:hypothetical protein
MGESSYDKVYKLLEATKECRELEAAVGRRIASMKVTGVTFSLMAPNSVGQPATASPRFVVSTDDGELMKVSGGDFWMESSSFVSTRDAKAVVEANFGVKGRVATYFCRKTVVLGDDNRRGTNSFHRSLCYSIGEKFDQEMRGAKERIKAQVLEMRESEAYTNAEREFLVGCAVKDIKAALAAYKHLGDATLKQAVQEFLCDDVFEFVDS